VEPTYRFKILSPKKQVLDADVVSVTAPGEMGYFGVLAGHAPFISMMRQGDVEVRLADGGEKRFRISGGIFHVEKNSAVLLAESVEETAATG
jgi:F-type H+-transporting ATPase subunit epsilon